MPELHVTAVPGLAVETGVVGAEHAAESFMGVVYRRTRYALAIVLSGWLFCGLGWKFAAPPADWGGVSLLVWGTAHPVMATMVLAVLLLIATGVSTALVHPDTPHMGLCCGLLGLAGLSIRGGTAYMLVRHGELTGSYAADCRLMAVECVQWGIIFFVAEMFARGLHDRFFANTRWLTRTGVDLQKTPGGHQLGMAVSVAKWIGTLNLPRPVAIVLAFIANMLLGSLFLWVILQNCGKGQVLFACFGAFLIATHLTYYAFPKIPAVTLFLAVPATAAVGYLFAANYPSVYPGHAGLYFGRALPIDYISTGAPGAIIGYYLALHWDLHSKNQEAA